MSLDSEEELLSQLNQDILEEEYVRAYHVFDVLSACLHIMNLMR